MDGPDADEARRYLHRAAETRREVDGQSPRPYGRLLVIASGAQILLFVAIGIQMYFYWRWESILLLVILAVALSSAVIRRTATARRVLPRGSGAVDRFRVRWTPIAVVIIAIVTGVLAPSILHPGAGEGNPWVFLIPGLAAAALVPQILLGIRLWRT